MKTIIFQSVLIALTFIILTCLGFGQSNATDDSSKMAADMEFCKEHARISSGYDPDNPEGSVSDTSRRDTRREGLRGAARGAAKGAVVGGVV